MLELFVIFSKGGIVLWWFQGASQLLTVPVNALVKDVVLQEKTGNSLFKHDKLGLKYRLDNEFELLYVVAYQAELALSYVDKLLTDVQREFRDKYKTDLQAKNIYRSFNFADDFHRVLKAVEAESLAEASKPREMRTWDKSAKSQKTVGSMVIDPNKKPIEKLTQTKSAKGKENQAPVLNGKPEEVVSSGGSGNESHSPDEDSIEMSRKRFIEKKGKQKTVAKGAVKSDDAPKKRVKESRKWDLGGGKKDMAELDVFKTSANSDEVNVAVSEMKLKGQMTGALKDLDTDGEEEEEEENSSDTSVSDASSSGGIFGIFKSLSMSKTLTKESVAPALEKMKDHLIAKNVASDIAAKLCDSVATKLEGKVLGTFSGVASTVKSTLQESCVQILSPKRRIDILRDAMDAKSKGQPYCITFCGVNGVGKSTNLSKVAFWLIENGLTVLIAACDTFRAGAVEQLRTHTRKLNRIQNDKKMVQLFDKGYDKDAAFVAMSALAHARDTKTDVVLVDTAGRMQDNEPLMRSLAKLIKVNQPDLVLFVGEALVGNEAVDQLVKFNQALADHSQQENPHLIDGIVLTKFDTIDDKVGAAISMTYITGQPIVFVGTGQTYTDLKTLNARAVVSALMKA
ncbi:signal recognition particle receptor subunit alpha-like [Watersipora subatra]|uniref:signal recognition particle receptor subunit alpha-like n=1 Tax=Watersipora subatra TaxID=2589382 RepID=UPI00355C4389